MSARGREISDGDPAAWDEILRRYGKLVSTTARSFRLHDADALTAMQMTWLRLAENADRVQFPERLGGWLATTARRECRRILRRAKSGPYLPDVPPETAVNPSAHPEQRTIDLLTQTAWKLDESEVIEEPRVAGMSKTAMIDASANDSNQRNPKGVSAHDGQGNERRRHRSAVGCRIGR